MYKCSFAAAQAHINKQKERTNRFIAEMFSLFLSGDMFAGKRDIFALLARYIVALRQCNRIQIPSHPQEHITKLIVKQVFAFLEVDKVQHEEYESGNQAACHRHKETQPKLSAIHDHLDIGRKHKRSAEQNHG